MKTTYGSPAVTRSVNESTWQPLMTAAGAARLFSLYRHLLSRHLSLSLLVFRFIVFLSPSICLLPRVSCQYTASRKGFEPTKLMRWAEPAVDIPWSIPVGDAAAAC